MSHDSPAASTDRSEKQEPITVRMVMPDRWLEQVEDIPGSTSVRDVKALGLRTMLQRSSDDPADFYIEYAERRVRDEDVSLAELGFRTREILAIRAYDLGHYKRFEG